MPTVVAELDFLAKLPLYEKQKPYHVFPSLDQELSRELESALTNVHWDAVEVTIHDTRDETVPFNLTESGFQIVRHVFEHNVDIHSLGSRLEYLKEVGRMLESFLDPRPDLVVPCDFGVSYSLDILSCIFGLMVLGASQHVSRCRLVRCQ